MNETQYRIVPENGYGYRLEKWMDAAGFWRFIMSGTGGQVRHHLTCLKAGTAEQIKQPATSHGKFHLMEHS